MLRYMKTIIKTVVFLLILAIVFLKLNAILEFKYTDGIYGMNVFYQLPEDTVDMLVLGSSHAFEDINPAVLYGEYGIAAYDLGGSVQPLWNTYYYLREALKTQSPRLVILEAYCVIWNNEYIDDSRVIKNTFGMHWTKERWDALEASTAEDRIVDFSIGLLQYHGRYAELTESDFLPWLGNEGLYKYWKGFVNNTATMEIAVNDISMVDKPIELYEKTEKYYREIIELCETYDIPLLVVVSPYGGISQEDQGKFLRAAEIADEYNVPFINYNTQYQEIGLDFTEDFADAAHLNSLGNVKFTEYLGEYLVENYELPDRRGDVLYYSWEMNLRYYNECLIEEEMAEYSIMAEYMANLPSDDCVVIVTTTVPQVWELIDKKELGVQQEESSQYKVMVIENGEVLYADDSEGSILWHKEFSGTDISVKAEMYGNVAASYKIKIGLTEYQQVTRGVNIVIYNTFTGEVVDAVGFNAIADWEIVRIDRERKNPYFLW